MLNLEVSALGFQPVLDVALGIPGETEHEVPLDLQLVDGLDGLVDLKGRRRCVNLAFRRAARWSPSTCRVGGELTLLSSEAISCWLAVERRKLLIWLFRGSSTSTSMS